MDLVILAAGHGRRFGGLKQLWPVGPRDEALMDYTAHAAARAGIGRIVLVVRREIRDAVGAHVRRHWPGAIELTLVEQGPVAGTAQAVLDVAPVVTGPFGVLNADDHYGPMVIDQLRSELGAMGAIRRPHLLVAFRLGNTVLTNDMVTRGICSIATDGRVLALHEHRVTRRDDRHFAAERLLDGAPRLVHADTAVSMNAWGFHPRIFDRLRAALEGHARSAATPAEVLLPEVVGAAIADGGDEFRAVLTDARCIGMTHRGDAALVREELRLAHAGGALARRRATA